MLQVSSSLAASIVAKATVATALGLTAAWLARGSRAAVRHAPLAAAFGVLLLLPAASIVAPPVRIALPAAAQKRTAPALREAAAIPPAAPPHTSADVTSVIPRSAPISPSALWTAGWIAGTALFLLPVIMGLWQVRSLRRSALPWRQGQSAVDRLAIEAGIKRRVELLLHGSLAGPMTCGVLHPAIVLPEDAQTWEEEDLNRAIVHELEHVRRGDWLSHCLARAVCAVYWFHPLVWMAWRRLGLEAERSCDDAVLGRSEATAYADQLVGIAQRLSVAAKMPVGRSPLLAMANRADLAARVGAVLDGRQPRGRAGTLPVAFACVAAAALVLTISPLRMVAAPQSAAGANPIQISAASNLVIVDVVVSDRSGNPVEDLSAGDFAVTEDGVPQSISVFEFHRVSMSQGTNVSSYYVLGYYTRNQNADGQFRKIKVTGNRDSMAKLDYRAGYYAAKAFPKAVDRVGDPGPAPSVDPGVTPPVLIRKTEPEYSEEARKAKYQGTVTLSVEVEASGQVTNAKVVRSLGLGLDEKAVQAVKNWKFRPGMQNLRPVAMEVQVQVSFRLL